jgi:hypothetical protein
MIYHYKVGGLRELEHFLGMGVIAVAAVVAYHSGRFSQLRKLALAIQNSGHAVILIIDGDQQCREADLAQLDYVLSIKPEYLKHLSFVNTFFTHDNDLAVMVPPASSVVSIAHNIDMDVNNHDIGWLVKTAKIYWPKSNYRIINQPLFQSNINIALSSFYPPEIINKNRFCLIPGGSLQLDQLIDGLNAAAAARDSIVYAPSLLSHPESRTIQDGELIIAALINNFPGYNIIYRPYPTEVLLPAVTRLKDKFTRCKNFIFDDNPSYLSSYARSLLLISDFSHTVVTFSFAALAPSIVCNFARNPQPPGIFWGIRSRLSNSNNPLSSLYFASQPAELISLIHKCLNTLSEHKNFIVTLRQRSIINAGNCANYIAQNMKFILNNEVNPQWAYLSANDPQWNEQKYFEVVNSVMINDHTYGGAVQTDLLLNHGLTLFPNSGCLNALQAVKILSASGKTQTQDEARQAAELFEKHRRKAYAAGFNVAIKNNKIVIEGIS